MSVCECECVFVSACTIVFEQMYVTLFLLSATEAQGRLTLTTESRWARYCARSRSEASRLISTSASRSATRCFSLPTSAAQHSGGDAGESEREDSVTEENK